ncbi:MAG: TonB-dependent receptor plug domain-containing protein, partial [Lutibacter sp.]|nr:TonB-dependent receptor plug domain-containing protein [Lutibacter sp.]
MAQNDTIKLSEVSVSSNRISLPFSNASRTITLITSDDIIRSSATNVADLLQNVAGIDIRRRGTNGMQSDLYIRGGNFDQTLLLIDGIKMDDAQTGHHSMNAMLSLENIERIEIIKGPASRVYGHNAFTGAVNIVTKKVVDNAMNLQLNYGSYKHTKASLSYYQNHAQGTFQAHTSYQQSDGYRFNTDFTNLSAFVKGSLGKQTLTASFASRKFGAKGFYASPDYKDQYEETETSLVAFSGDYQSAAVRIKPRVYWRRNQDTYLFLRHDPSYYKNVHIANKAGAETNMVIHSALGKTGLGLDLARVFLVSNNLGDHQR